MTSIPGSVPYTVFGKDAFPGVCLWLGSEMNPGQMITQENTKVCSRLLRRIPRFAHDIHQCVSRRRMSRGAAEGGPILPTGCSDMIVL